MQKDNVNNTKTNNKNNNNTTSSVQLLSIYQQINKATGGNQVQIYEIIDDKFIKSSAPDHALFMLNITASLMSALVNIKHIIVDRPALIS